MEYKLGGFGQRTEVVVDDDSIRINKTSFDKDAFIMAYVVENSMVYLSKDGVINKNPYIQKCIIYFKRKESDQIREIINNLGVDVVNFDNLNEFNQYVKNQIFCPACKGGNIQFMQNERKAFSVGKAVGGAILTGGIGTLAGFTGKKGKKNSWYCNSCHNVFIK